MLLCYGVIVKCPITLCAMLDLYEAHLKSSFF